MNADFILAIGELGKEKGIDPEFLFQAVEEALITAYKKNFGSNQNVRISNDKATGRDPCLRTAAILWKRLARIRTRFLWRKPVKSIPVMKWMIS